MAEKSVLETLEESISGADLWILLVYWGNQQNNSHSFHVRLAGILRNKDNVRALVEHLQQSETFEFGVLRKLYINLRDLFKTHSKVTLVSTRGQTGASLKDGVIDYLTSFCEGKEHVVRVTEATSEFFENASAILAKDDPILAAAKPLNCVETPGEQSEFDLKESEDSFSCNPVHIESMPKFDSRVSTLSTYTASLKSWAKLTNPGATNAQMIRFLVFGISLDSTCSSLAADIDVGIHNTFDSFAKQLVTLTCGYTTDHPLTTAITMANDRQNGELADRYFQRFVKYKSILCCGSAVMNESILTAFFVQGLDPCPARELLLSELLSTAVTEVRLTTMYSKLRASTGIRTSETKTVQHVNRPKYCRRRPPTRTNEHRYREKLEFKATTSPFLANQEHRFTNMNHARRVKCSLRQNKPVWQNKPSWKEKPMWQEKPVWLEKPVCTTLHDLFIAN